MRKYKKEITFLFVAIAFFLVSMYQLHLEETKQQIAGKVLRFHVLANSDCAEDQALKLAVRDQVGTYVGAQLSGATSLEESQELLIAHLDDIEQCAQEEIDRHGYHYDVTASLESTYFPEKAYGKASFPAGEYQALRVVIGEGAGKNWWCVLYPNLCFMGNLYQVDEEAGAEKLKQVLSPEEYQLVMESKDYEIKSKLVEIMEEIFTNP